ADLIEHLSNPGGFLECVKRHLREDGVLCLVTPNAFSLNSAFKTLLGMRVNINPEHTCWHDRNTLRQLLARHGFAIVEEYWQDYQAHSIAAFFRRAMRPRGRRRACGDEHRDFNPSCNVATGSDGDLGRVCHGT